MGTIVFIYLLVRVLRLSRLSESVMWDSWKLYWIVWISCLAGILLTVWRKKREYIALFLLICFGLYPFNQILTDTRTSNQEKLNEIRYVLEHTTSEDTVMDGWSGLGVFRDHAYYYYFVHKGVRPMMTKKERSEDVIKALKENDYSCHNK